jgi:hypothetical protein
VTSITTASRASADTLYMDTNTKPQPLSNEALLALLAELDAALAYRAPPITPRDFLPDVEAA